MAFGRETTAKNVKPLLKEGAIVMPGRLGATTEAGEFVALQSDEKWDPAIATGVVFTLAVAVQGGIDGDVVDLVVFGPVQCLTDATPGGLIYVSDTAGEPSTSAGTKTTIAGYAREATVLFVQPQIVSFS